MLSLSLSYMLSLSLSLSADISRPDSGDVIGITDLIKIWVFLE